jgi:5-methylcytosine-specific restriction endonuclease McrA
MQRVIVLNKNRQALMPCAPFRARKLLNAGKAVVLKLHPFTIILKNREEGRVQNLEVKIDPGSKTTGLAVVANFQKGRTVIWAANLEHKGSIIRSSLDARRSLRRGRRSRKTRYRSPRFNNRTRKEGWLAPSLQSRVDNINTWVARLLKLLPLSSIVIETVRFHMQKLQNPEITGIEYQQGELLGYEIREYLLEKWGRKCVYCGLENTRLEIDHVIPKSKGGSDRISNLTLSCRACNIKKGNSSIQQFLNDKPHLLSSILIRSKTPLKDSAAVNATRYAIGNTLRTYQLPLTFCSGGRTKFNRVKQSYKKDHWIDAACLGETGECVQISPSFMPLIIRAQGRGSRQFCLMDKYGFPRTSAKKQKSVHGFKTGDLVKAIVTKGKKIGTYFGRVGVRLSGNFCIDTSTGKVDGLSYKYCRNVQRSDGYSYLTKKKPNARSGVSSSP